MATKVSTMTMAPIKVFPGKKNQNISLQTYVYVFWDYCYISPWSIRDRIMKVNLCLPCHEEVWGSGGRALPLLTSTLAGGEWSASCLCRVTRGNKAPDIHWVGDCAGPSTGWTLCRREKPYPCWESNPGRPALRYTDWAIPTHQDRITLFKIIK
jgi:hypothetical protein